MFRLLKDVFIWFYWYPFRVLVQMLPLKAVYFIGDIGGVFLYGISKKRRELLRRVIPLVIKDDKPDPRIFKTVAKRALRLFCKNEMELFLYPKLNSSGIKNMIRLEGSNYLEHALKKGKGVMLFFAHFGANQMVMPSIGYRGYKMNQMSAPSTVWKEKLPNKKFTRMSEKGLELRWTFELSLPVKHINIFGSMKKAFMCLKRNEVLGIAMDGGGGSKRVPVDFLGKKALFSTGAIEIAMRTGCGVLPTFIVRGKGGRQTMIIEPPLSIMTGCDNAVEFNTSAFVKRLEEYIYRYPCHYLNFLALRTFMEEQGDSPFFVKGDERKLP